MKYITLEEAMRRLVSDTPNGTISAEEFQALWEKSCPQGDRQPASVMHVQFKPVYGFRYYWMQFKKLLSPRP